MDDVAWGTCECCNKFHVNQVHTLNLHRDWEQWHLNAQGAASAHNIFYEVVSQEIVNYTQVIVNYIQLTLHYTQVAVSYR